QPARQLREDVPLVAGRDETFLERKQFSLSVGRDKSVRAVMETKSHGGYLLVVAQRDASVNDPKPEDLCGVGLVAEVLQVDALPGQSTHVTLEARARARVREYLETGGYFRVRIEILREDTGDTPNDGVADDSERLAALHQAYVDELKSQALIHTAPVEAAFRAVPRHLFVPGFPLD